MTTATPAVETGEVRPSLRERLDRPLTEPCLLFLVVLALVAVGVMMVYSASRTAGAGRDNAYFARHLLFVPLALAAMVAGMRVPHRWLRRPGAAWGLLLATVALLVGVLFLGVQVGGARRWYRFWLGPMPVHFQPSELAKFALIVFLAWYFSRSRVNPRHGVDGFLVPMAAIGVVCGLIVKEDFGTAALVGIVATGLCLIAGWRWWFPLLLIGPAGVLVYVMVVLEPFRLDRIRVWWNPWEYLYGPGWHVCQSLMGIGSGGLWGVGLGRGVQKLYIPENTTDFVFAVLCEEMGLVGGLLVLGLFGVFVWRGLRVARGAADRFGFLLASGILLTIGLQAALNIAVVTGALPAKGISLPFISYGGSGLLVTGLAAGLLASVARQGGAGAGAADRLAPLVYRPSAEGRSGAEPRA